MVIGEGPGKDEDAEGRPFVGKSGQFLRMVLRECKVEQNTYISNVVCCRSCGQAADLEGNLRWRNGKHGREPVIIDKPPSKLEVNSCLPRLHEEIYLVDPVIIVTLGVAASEAVLNRSITMMSENGTTHIAKIPGAGYSPQLTEKRKQWLRKLRGQYVMPVEQNSVEYLTIPIFHPAWVLRMKEDKRFKNPVESFVKAMAKASQIYIRFVHEVYGDQLEEPSIEASDIERLQEELQDG